MLTAKQGAAAVPAPAEGSDPEWTPSERTAEERDEEVPMRSEDGKMCGSFLGLRPRPSCSGSIYASVCCGEGCFIVTAPALQGLGYCTYHIRRAATTLPALLTTTAPDSMIATTALRTVNYLI